MKKKSRFQAHVKNISLRHIKSALKTIPEFSDLKSWKLKHLGIGEMMHTYLLSKGNKKYFVKEVKPHEAQVHYFLSILNLKHLPHSVYPELLKRKILIIAYIGGGMMPETKRKIDYDLLRDFIEFQNRMNNKRFFDRYNKIKIKNFSQRDVSWLKGRFERNLKIGKENLLKLKRKYKLPITDKYLKIVDALEPQKAEISEDFRRMPFARQHHDFREDNMLGKKHKLIDWGSSYGYGPFMYDLSIFLAYDKKAFDIVMKKSDIARKATREQVKRWLYVALANRFNDFCKWHIRPGTPNERSKTRLKKALEYNYKTYKYLLEK